jgi:hypothetical protein
MPKFTLFTEMFNVNFLCDISVVFLKYTIKEYNLSMINFNVLAIATLNLFVDGLYSFII